MRIWMKVDGMTNSIESWWLWKKLEWRGDDVHVVWDVKREIEGVRVIVVKVVKVNLRWWWEKIECIVDGK